MKPKAPSLKVLALALLGLLLLATLVFVLRRAGPLAPVRVTVAQAIEGRLSPVLFGIGSVEARRSVSVGPTVAGRVLRVLVDVGDPVQSGQLLAEMDPVDLDSRLAALDATLARAASAIAAAQAQTLDTGARRELATRVTRRYTQLGDQGFVSGAATDAKLQEQTSAEAAASAAQANLLAARQDVVRLQADRAALAQQRNNLRLVAMQHGVVVARDAEPGATVVAGQSVLKLVDPTQLWVKTRFDQGQAGGLAAGQAARVVLRSAPGAPLTGKVARVELQGDSVTQERTAQIALDALPVGISIGELAEVTLQLPELPSAVLVPNAAIKRVGAQTGVWLLSDGQPRFAPLRLGHGSLDGRVQVLDGLNAGAPVLVYSEKELHANSRIEVVERLVTPSTGRGTP